MMATSTDCMPTIVQGDELRMPHSNTAETTVTHQPVNSFKMHDISLKKYAVNKPNVTKQEMEASIHGSAHIRDQADGKKSSWPKDWGPSTTSNNTSKKIKHCKHMAQFSKSVGTGTSLSETSDNTELNAEKAACPNNTRRQKRVAECAWKSSALLVMLAATKSTIENHCVLEMRHPNAVCQITAVIRARQWITSGKA